MNVFESCFGSRVERSCDDVLNVGSVVKRGSKNYVSIWRFE